MARSRRPQAASGQVTSYGVPTTQISTGVSGADTFVDPGLANMPTPPTKDIAPTPYDPSQDARIKDLLAMSDSYAGLSHSLKAWGQTSMMGRKVMYQFGAEHAELKNLMLKSGGVWAEAIDSNVLDALTHPDAQKGMADALSELTVRDAAGKIDDNIEDFRATNEASMNLASSMEWFDQEIAGLPRPNIARIDVFDRGILKHQSKYRDLFESKQRKWLSERALDDTKDSLVSEIHSIIDVASLLDSEPTVVRNKLGFIKNIIAPTSDEIFEKNVEGGAVRMEEIIEGRMGGLLLPREVHELMGTSLVNRAVTEDDPTKSKMSIEILKNTLTGQKGDKKKLIDIPAVKNYYKSKKDQIAAHQRSSSSAQFLRNLQKYTRMEKDSAVETLHQNMIAHLGKLGDEKAIDGMFSQIFEGTRHGELGPGVLAVREGDVAVLRAKNEEGVLVSTEINMRTVVKEARALYWSSQKKAQSKWMEETGFAEELRNKDYSEDAIDAVAEVKTSVETGSVSRVLVEELQQTYSMTSILRDNLETDLFQEKTGPNFEQFKRGMAAVATLMETGNYVLFDQHLPDSGSRVFWETAHALMTDEVVARYGGGSFEKVYQRMVGMSDTRPLSLTNFSSLWDQKGIPLIENHMSTGWFGGGPAYADPNKARQDIESVAQTLFAIGAIPDIEGAIDVAIDNYFKFTVDLGGTRVRKSQVSPQLLKNGVPEEWDHKVRIDSDMMTLLESIGAGHIVKSNVAYATNIMDVIDNAWYSGVQGENRQKEIFDLHNKMLDQINEMGKPEVRNIQVGELLESAKRRFEMAPPDWWISENLEVGGIDSMRWVMAKGSGGWKYFLQLESNLGGFMDTGNPNNHDRPWTLRELSDIAKEGESGVNLGLPVGAKPGEYIDISQWMGFMKDQPHLPNIFRDKRTHWMKREDFISYSGPGSSSRTWEERRLDIRREDSDEELMGPTYD